MSKELAKKQLTYSERFTNMVMKEFSANIGVLELSEKQKKLSQHLFLKCDAQLKALEAKRLKNNDKNHPYIWENINLSKLALDAVNRIDLGLDALIPNHISPIPYFNSKEKKYDFDLRIGYSGEDYYRRKTAINEPIDIIYELVYENDTFKPVKKSMKNKVENYEFEITKPFDRGNVIGGFGYLVFEDAQLNKLIIVTEKDFKKSENMAPGDKFWGKFPVEMRYKTLVHRVTDKLQVDPDKVNQSYFKVEADGMSNQKSIESEIDQNANSESLGFEEVEEAEVIEPPQPEPDKDFDEDGTPIPKNKGVPVDDAVEEKGPGF